MKKLSTLLLALLSLSIFWSTFAEQAAQVPNPASVNCIEKWWTSKTVKGKAWEYSFCVFDNGSSCEEWALFRWECKNEWDYINKDLYTRLEKQESHIVSLLSEVSDEVLEKAIENIEDMIERTKLLRITQEAQKMRITQLVFLRYAFTIELGNR